MTGFEFVLWGVVASFATALLFAALAALLGRGDAPTGPRWGVALGVGFGYILGHLVMSEWHSGDRPASAWKAVVEWWQDGGEFPLFPGNGWDWLPWVVAASTIVGLLDGTWPAPRWVRWQNRVLLTSLLMWLVLGPLVAGMSHPARWIVGLGIATIALWAILDRRAARLGSAMPFVLMVPAIGMAVAQRFSGSVTFAFLSAALAATMGGIWVVSWFNPRMNLARAAIPTYSLAYAGLIIGGLFYASLPWISAAALAIAPLASFIDRAGPWRIGLDENGEPTRGDWKTSLARLAAMLVPIGVAVVVAWRSYGET